MNEPGLEVTIHWPWGWVVLLILAATLALSHWAMYREGRENERHDALMAHIDAILNDDEP